MVFSVAFAYASGSAGFADAFDERNFKKRKRRDHSFACAF